MATPPAAVPADAPVGAWALWPVGAAVMLGPALGMPTTLVLQDTLKSAIVAFGALLGALGLFQQLRSRPTSLAWHPLLLLPLALCAYALGSMAWSHAYLGGVEAVRWFIVAVLLFVGLQALTPGRARALAAAIHAGAVVATLWAALQFWFDWPFFAQGPPPGSTFLNRNFFAEYAACALPFGAMLAMSARRPAYGAAIGASVGFVATGILMTGTRSALLALWLMLLVLLPLAAWRFRDRGKRAAVFAGAALVAVVLVLGSLPSGNARLIGEERGATPIERGLRRTASIQPGDSSLQLRQVMWQATLRMIAEQPLQGVGAGAWEVFVPLYLGDRAQLETDYYVHNETLQLLAEDGLVGAICLLGLLAYLLRAAVRTLRDRGDATEADAPARVAALSSLLALLVVSQAGFPLRLAATGALFAISLAVLAASDRRLAARWIRHVAWRPRWTAAALVANGVALGLAAVITRQAVLAEGKLVRAEEIALLVSESGDWGNPRWFRARSDALQLVREGVALHPHYRKITPAIGDEFARWGDWANATWIWESVLASRPFVVALLTNAARGHVAQGDVPGAFEYLARAKQIAPNAPSVVSLNVILLARYGDAREALALAREALDAGREDLDLLNNAFVLGWRADDEELAERAMATRIRKFPRTRVGAWMDLAEYRLQAHRDLAGAVTAWREALAASPPSQRDALLLRVPPEYRTQAAGR